MPYDQLEVEKRRLGHLDPNHTCLLVCDLQVRMNSVDYLDDKLFLGPKQCDQIGRFFGFLATF